MSILTAEFQDVASLRKTDGDDEVYFITKRGNLDNRDELETGWEVAGNCPGANVLLHSLVSFGGYLYALDYTSGRLFKSVSGVGWSLVYTFGTLGDTLCVLDGVLYASAGAYKLHRRVSDGVWTEVSTVGSTAHFLFSIGSYLFLFDGQAGSYILRRSANNGATWSDLGENGTFGSYPYQEFTDFPSGTSGILVDGDYTYVCCGSSGVWRSSDGTTFTQISTQDLDTVCGEGGTFYAWNNAAAATARYKSTDGGVTWTLQSAEINNVYCAVFYDGVIWKMVHETAIYSSDDNGVTWTNAYSDSNLASKSVVVSGGYIFCFNGDAIGTVLRGPVPVYADQYYLETLAERVTDPASADCIFLDCAIQYSGSSTTTLTGLAHLEGLRVWVLSAGAVQTTYDGDPLVVTNGALTLDSAVANAVIGLPYTADIETLPLELQQGTTSMGRLKAARTMVLRVNETKGFLMGPDSDKLTTPGEWEELTASEVFTGELEHRIKGDWNTLGHVFVRQEQPFPMTIQAIVNFVETD